MERINIGIIGCGLISTLHVAGYRDNPKVSLYAICDVDEQLLAARKNEWGMQKGFADYRELLADPAVDAVEIITPHKLHEQITIDALDAGKHVALQKPMTTSLESADRIVAHARKSGLVFKVTDHYVAYPPIVLAREMIENGEIGDPQMLRMKMINSAHGGWDMPVASYDWRFDEFAEGRFSETFDHGHHEWATARYLMGDVERSSTIPSPSCGSTSRARSMASASSCTPRSSTYPRSTTPMTSGSRSPVAVGSSSFIAVPATYTAVPR
jgi:predicted dehydrogenase